MRSRDCFPAASLSVGPFHPSSATQREPWAAGTGRGAGRGGRTEVVRAKDEVTSLAGTTASALTAFSQMTTARRGSGGALVKEAEGTDSLQGLLSRTVSSEQLQADRNARALALAAKMTAVAGGPLMSPGISPG